MPVSDAVCDLSAWTCSRCSAFFSLHPAQLMYAERDHGLREILEGASFVSPSRGVLRSKEGREMTNILRTHTSSRGDTMKSNVRNMEVHITIQGLGKGLPVKKSRVPSRVPMPDQASQHAKDFMPISTPRPLIGSRTPSPLPTVPTPPATVRPSLMRPPSSYASLAYG